MSEHDPDRMKLIDSMWLDIDTADGPIAVGAVMEFNGRAPALKRVQQRIADVMPQVPRLSQTPEASRSGVLQPKWVDVDVDLDFHVQRHTVSNLEAAVARLLAEPMTEGRALWDVTILTGYAPREWALVWRLHHAVADGEGVTMLIGRTLDMAPTGGETLTDWMVSQASALRGQQPELNPVEKLAQDVRDTFTQVVGAALTAPETIRSLMKLAPHRPTSLTGTPSTGRDWRCLHLDLSEVKAAGKAHGATVNDVLMAAVTNGFREVILSHGEDPSGRVVRAVMPVSMRKFGDTRSNNQVSMIPVELPVGEQTNQQRLAAVVRQTSAAKRSMVAKMIETGHRTLSKITPAPLEDLILTNTGWTFGWLADTLVTNVRGPETAQYFLGQEVRYLAPIIPVGSTLRMVVGINSYNGTVNVGVTTDAEHAHDNDLMIKGIASAVADLRLEQSGAKSR